MGFYACDYSQWEDIFEREFLHVGGDSQVKVQWQ